MNNENNTAAQQTNADPAVNGESKQGRTFTQEEVNQIVSNRLAQERAKGEPTEAEKRESEIAAREAALACREYISQKAIRVSYWTFSPLRMQRLFKLLLKN